MMGYWILSRVFSVPIEMIMWFLFSIIFTGYIPFIDLYMLNHSWFSRMKPIWLWCMIFLNMLSNSVCKYFIMDFSTFVSRKLVYNFLFCSIIQFGH
jgi:hypothetical protein